MGIVLRAGSALIWVGAVFTFLRCHEPYLRNKINP